MQWLYFLFYFQLHSLLQKNSSVKTWRSECWNSSLLFISWMALDNTNHTWQPNGGAGSWLQHGNWRWLRSNPLQLLSAASSLNFGVKVWDSDTFTLSHSLIQNTWHTVRALRSSAWVDLNFKRSPEFIGAFNHSALTKVQATDRVPGQQKPAQFKSSRRTHPQKKSVEMIHSEQIMAVGICKTPRRVLAPVTANGIDERFPWQIVWNVLFKIVRNYQRSLENQKSFSFFKKNSLSFSPVYKNKM